MLISLDKQYDKVSASKVYKFWIESISKFWAALFQFLYPLHYTKLRYNFYQSANNAFQ